MLFQRPLVAACLLIRAALAITLCSSADSTYAGSWPRIPWDCADESHDKLSILGVGTPLSSIETGESEVLLGRFRYYMTRSNPHFAKISVILSSKHMDLYWTPDGDNKGLAFPSYTSRGCQIFWTLQRKWGFREARVKWESFNGVSGNFILARRTRHLSWPKVPSRIEDDRPWRIIDITDVGTFVPIQDKPEIETLLEEKFPRTLFASKDFHHITLMSSSKRYFYTVTLEEPRHDDSIDRSSIWYAHQTFMFLQWHFGFREAKLSLKDVHGKEVCKLELHIFQFRGLAPLNATDTS